MRACTLDRPELYDALDVTRMSQRIAGLADQARAAWRIGSTFRPERLKSPARVVVAGMGGSAIGADIVSAFAATRSTVPVQVVRGPVPPRLGADALLVASSHSGDTSEVLSAISATAGGPCQRLAITRGGELAQLAGELGMRVVRFEDDGEPRSALGYGVFLLLGVLRQLGAIEVDDHEVETAICEFEQHAITMNPSVPTERNAAKQLAERLRGQAPLIIGEGLLQVPATRWQNQFNENSKQWAFTAALPELGHNQIEGFAHPRLQQLSAVILEDCQSSAIDGSRRSYIVDRLAASGISVDRVPIEASTPLSALMQACHIGDWVSLHLAMLNGVDPAAMPNILDLKAHLSSNGVEPAHA